MLSRVSGVWLSMLNVSVPKAQQQNRVVPMVRQGMQSRGDNGKIEELTGKVSDAGARRLHLTCDLYWPCVATSLFRLEHVPFCLCVSLSDDYRQPLNRSSWNLFCKLVVIFNKNLRFQHEDYWRHIWESLLALSCKIHQESNLLCWMVK